MLRRYRVILVYVTIFIITVYFTSSFFKISQKNKSISILDISVNDNNNNNNNQNSNTTDDFIFEQNNKDINEDSNLNSDLNSNSNSNSNSNLETDQYNEEIEIDKFLNNAITTEDESKEESDSSLKDDISKMTDEEIREQLNLIKEKQAEKELEKLKQSSEDVTNKNEDNVKGTQINNSHRIRKDKSPDGKDWAQYEIERIIPENYDNNDNFNIQRENATLFTLCRNSELYEILDSIEQLENRFNKNFHYDWVFLNDEPFSEEFIELTSNMISGRARYGLIPIKHWSYPPYIDEQKAKEIRESRKWASITYGTSESYRHMCRFNSMFFYKHPIIEEYQYYWRVEPHVNFDCDIIDDPFKFMNNNNKKYGFTISMRELPNTIETLWETSKLYFKKLSYDIFDQVTQNNLVGFISDDNGSSYNLCHYWTNFEIANLDIYRNDLYEGYVQHLDHAGGFFYERWGDAPVHSIIFSLMLKREELYLFQNISYEHTVAKSCPLNDAFRKKARCVCNPVEDWTIKSNNCCNSKFLEVGKYEKNDDYDKYVGLLKEKKAEEELLKSKQRKLRMETARRQSEERRKKSEERRKNRLEAQKSKKKNKQNKEEADKKAAERADADAAAAAAAAAAAQEQPQEAS
ncbi:alpha 1,2-mannosyltransferase 2.4.1 [Pichia californica]|uniref:Alpha 1,2-mannosyltransferase 2.4.1 n=1 Tax=Pichia californica TaxID=460514 RepID=A0A9P6WIT8_9ASCO|nr:alpha 1,2-mannosyltransferase 2.4.1 [[Candida] californica]